jgi:hypothetical protein
MGRVNRFIAWPLCAIALAGSTYAAITPPVMTLRTAPVATETRGERVVLRDGSTEFTLFLPNGWTDATKPTVAITAHFHTIASSAIALHERRGAREPLLVFALGSGSSAYRAPFEDTNRFARILSLVEREMSRRGVNTPISAVDVSSFSAGYGAVRELVKSPQYFSLIRRIVLLDSIYGGLVVSPPGSTNRFVEATHVDVWVPFAKAAMRNEKTFVITLSQIEPETFASTVECATALLDRVSLKLLPIKSSPTSTNSLPLLARADSGDLHVWSYAGTNGFAHMAHVQNMAEVWRAIETH